MKKNFENNEVFSAEELERLNGILKENEEIIFPESLSAENVEKMICEKSAFENERAAVEKAKSGKKSRASRKKLFMRIIAAAAVLVFVFTSMITLKPWERERPVASDDKGTTAAENANRDYTELQKLFVGYSKRYKIYNNVFFDVFNGGFGAKAEDTAVSESVNSSSDGTGGVVFGKTNEQVEGVSEADIIKNDGEYIYATAPSNADWDSLYLSSDTYTIAGEKVNTSKEFTFDCAVSIVKQGKNGELKNAGRAEVEFSDEDKVFYAEVKEFFVSENRLYAVVGADCVEDEESTNAAMDCIVYGGAGDKTLLICFDISKKEKPVELWRTEQEGAYVSSRMTNGRLVVITDKYVNITLSEDEVKESCIPEAGVNGEVEKISSDSIYFTEVIRDSRYAVVSLIDLNKGAESFEVKAILGGGENVYCTAETLYVTSSVYEGITGNGAADTVADIFSLSDDSLSKTEIIKFKIGDSLEYCGKASVNGRALNQFSIDEYNGYLRIATTTGNWGDSLENFVTVLDGELKEVGILDGIARGETIKSVRFSGDTAYVVTFKQVDPLFVIDLKDPTAPKITGELKIPGFSAYLHPVSDTLLLGVGVDGDEERQGCGLKLSLFDVSNPAEPKEVSKYEINGKDISGDDGSYSSKRIYSGALYSHKALCFDNENGVVYIPFISYEDYYNPTTKVDTYTATSGAYAFKLDEREKTVTLLKEYIGYSGDEVTGYSGSSRVTFTGDYVYFYEQQEGEISSFEKNGDEIVSTVKLG